MYNLESCVNDVEIKLTSKGEVYYKDDKRKVNIKLKYSNHAEAHIAYMVLNRKLDEYNFNYYENFKNIKECSYYDFNMDINDEQKQELKDGIEHLINARKEIKKYLKKHIDTKGTYHYNDINQVEMKIKNLINTLY